MHKFFPILLLCQCLSFGILLVFWYWRLSKDMANQIRSVIDYCDNLTEYFRKYDKGMRNAVTEATLHREIDNCLEFIMYLFMNRAKRIYISTVIKWVSVMIVACAWFVGYFVMILPNLVIFEDNFLCLYENDLKAGVQRVAECTVPTSTFLRAVWYINQVLLGLLALVAMFHGLELCQRRSFSSSFFYRTVPGLQDGRLAESVDLYFNARHLSLLSRFCDSNLHLCKDAGLSKSLARKYGAPDGWTPGRETLVDKHFPVIQPEQLRKFRLTSEKYYRKKQSEEKKKAKTVKVRPVSQRKATINRNSRNAVTPGKTTAASGRSQGTSGQKRIPGFEYDQSMYMTSHLLGRKLEKDLRSVRSSKKWQGSTSSTPKTYRSDVRLNELAVAMTTPRAQMDYRPRGAGYYPSFTTRNREFNPHAYNLDLMIRRNYADNLNNWKP